MTKKYNESVLCVRSDDSVKTWEQLLKQEVFIIDRNIAERNLSFRQIIPYVTIRTSQYFDSFYNNYDTIKFFTYQRLKGDDRLNAKYSIGVGGHMNCVDQYNRTNDLATCIMDEALREVNEELYIEGPLTGNLYQGRDLIVLSESEVDKVHLGVRLILITDSPVTVKETDSMVGEFKSVNEIKSLDNKLENWSKVIIDSYV